MIAGRVDWELYLELLGSDYVLQMIPMEFGSCYFSCANDVLLKL